MKIKCPYCRRMLVPGDSALFSHCKKKHPAMTAGGDNAIVKKPAIKGDDGPDEGSMADIFIEAQRNKAAGIKNPLWLDMVLGEM